jgi:site-specific recombinase XerD
MTLLAAPLQRYFTDFARIQRELSPNTIAAYRDTWRLLIKHATSTLGVTADQLDLAMIDTELVTSFLNDLAATRANSISTCNARLSALRAVLAYALPDYPEHADTISRVLAIPARRHHAAQVEFLTDNEVDALIAAPDTATWTGRRDRALLVVAVRTGLRISELVALTTADVHTGTGAHISCIGKGRRHRATPLTSATLTVLAPYLTERATRPGAALFPSPSGGHLSRDALEHRLAKHLDTAAKVCVSLNNKHVTMHTLRHTAVICTGKRPVSYVSSAA